MQFYHQVSQDGCSGIHIWVVKFIKERSTSQMKVAYYSSYREDEVNDYILVHHISSLSCYCRGFTTVRAEKILHAQLKCCFVLGLLCAVVKHLVNFNIDRQNIFQVGTTGKYSTDLRLWENTVIKLL